ncbi:MAG: hypothetical protein LBT97_13690 [Planctomycetota bacterium]|jgi:hypothetical protein|nr:hypothetical protein [Planctomycetota bacterium]
MIVKEGRLGRVFVIALGADDRLPWAVENFALEHGIGVAQVVLTADRAYSGIIAPDGDGRPVLTLAGESLPEGDACEAVVQEVLGLRLRRKAGSRDGAPRLTPDGGAVTRVMEKAAPVPLEKGPATVPIYLFNAEFN